MQHTPIAKGGRMITHEVLAKLRLDHTSLLARMAALSERADQEGTHALSHDISMLQNELRDYVGLVDAIVDALSPDVPKRLRAVAPP